MLHEDCYELGYIQKTHALKGEMVFFLDVDEPLDYEDMDSIFLEISGKLVPYFVEKVRVQRQAAIVKLEAIDTIEQAHPLVGSKLFLPLEKLPELAADEFYYHDIIGYTVKDEQLGILGEITDYYELPQHDVLEMVYQGKTILIPVNDDIILGADHEEKYLETSLPQGLLEIYLGTDTQEDDSEEKE
ncbi:MAG: 16S rRNA processing protein RimM [Verrucomicrobia bacterium]|nr:16S rRNA processing protein RimM [Cytophagales bacterium]